jgi:RNA recognition motif-containing protein
MSKVYIGNLSYSIGEEELRKLFGSHGQVVSCKIITDYDTGRSKGFGFVEMSSKEEASNAISSLDQTEMEGRVLKVNEARERNNSNNQRW